MAARFTKAETISQITDRAKRYQETNGFVPGNGTSQLWPKGADEKTKALIDKAVAYGAMRTLYGIAEDIESGHLGVTKGYPAREKL